MEVILNVQNTCTFDGLLCGQCFMTVDAEDTQDIYMVVKTPLKNLEEGQGLAADVRSGKLFNFRLDEIVKPVDAKLTVTY